MASVRVRKRSIKVTCPMCDYGRMTGSAMHGYRCGKCKSHFSARFVRHIRRKNFQELIHTHFVSKPKSESIHTPENVTRVEQVEESRLEIPESTIREVAQEASESVVRTGKQLEDFVELSELFPSVKQRLKEAAPQMPHEVLKKERRSLKGYDVPKSTSVKKSRKKRKQVKRAMKGTRRKSTRRKSSK